ncbi:response regulator [Candidatus Magnetomonas plexicatena]|uniref:response regulator n=1 Tax=Candidatus Magnetomonas plexicatena TaxID=2552947 RepID=UPI001C743E7F|nr:response regulator [Nitrospirales bacterium LBB_01]
MDSIKVFLVDDEKAFVEILAQRLAMRKYVVEVAYNGAEAIERLKSYTPHVIVLDMKMPGMDGLDVFKWIKQHHPAIPVIILTGYSSEKEEKEARKLGVFDFLRKPPEIDVLIKTLKNACKPAQ